MVDGAVNTNYCDMEVTENAVEIVSISETILAHDAYQTQPIDREHIAATDERREKVIVIIQQQCNVVRLLLSGLRRPARGRERR